VNSDIIGKVSVSPLISQKGNERINAIRVSKYGKTLGQQFFRWKRISSAKIQQYNGNEEGEENAIIYARGININYYLFERKKKRFIFETRHRSVLFFDNFEIGSNETYNSEYFTLSDIITKIGLSCKF
jgi:hypothetical protein